MKMCEFLESQIFQRSRRAMEGHTAEEGMFVH
jgi:hypothetical protein